MTPPTTQATLLPTAPETSTAGSSRHRIIVPLLLAAGVGLWYFVDRNSWYSPAQFILLAVQAAIVSSPPVNRWLTGKMAYWASPAPRTRIRISIAFAVSTSLYLYFSAWQQQRDFFPKLHDEYMHLVQARLLSHGKLWSAPHAFPRFFETFHVFVTPIYTGQHFPGTALFYVPGIWLGLPWWITSLAIAGAAIGMMYRIVAEIVDGVAGFVAAIMLLGTLELRYLSLMVISNTPALLLGLSMIWAWLHWRQKRQKQWAIALGLLSGLAAITRPPDALCFAIPIAIAILLDIRRIRFDTLANPHKITRTKVVAVTGTAVLVGAIPFLLLQLIFDHGVTGRWLKTPHQYYGDLYYPGVVYGFREPSFVPRPATSLPQKLDYYDGFLANHMQRYTPRTALHEWIETRLPALFKASLPSPLMMFLLPLGLLGFVRKDVWVLATVFPLFVVFYAPNIMYASSYAILVSAAMIPLALFGAKNLESFIEATFPRLHHRTSPILTTLLIAISLAALPQFNPAVTEQFPSRTIAAVEIAMKTIDGRAIVFFRYQHNDNVHEEPVYNIDSAYIDSSRIVRAQDLGATENLKLIRYYAERQPDRRVYLFNRTDRTLTALGPVIQ